MPLYNFRCEDESCDVFFEGYVSLQDWPKTLPCPKCSGPTAKDHVRRAVDRGVPDPVVVYQAPDGTYRFPPDTTSLSTKMYDDLGYTRHELRGWKDVRRFETQMNKFEMSQVRRRVERQQEQYEASEKARRSEIRRGLEQGFQIPETDERGRPTGRMQTVRLSPRGRDIMQAAIEMNDRKGGPTAKEVGFHVEVYSHDRSNRAPDPRRRGQ